MKWWLFSQIFIQFKFKWQVMIACELQRSPWCQKLTLSCPIKGLSNTGAVFLGHPVSLVTSIYISYIHMLKIECSMFVHICIFTASRRVENHYTHFLWWFLFGWLLDTSWSDDYITTVNEIPIRIRAEPEHGTIPETASQHFSCIYHNDWLLRKMEIHSFEIWVQLKVGLERDH